MKHLLNPGKYIIAVSGGIDSVALLHMFQGNKNLELIVAHFDHGIREDSAEDADFVRGLAALYELDYETERAELGSSASENTARMHRYMFLQKLKEKHLADAIVTAHHQDDRIETAAINMLRGTARRGLVSLRSYNGLQRPLLNMSKDEIRDYVVTHKLEYREDSTNASKQYLRNRVRARLHGVLTPKDRIQLINLLNTIETDNYEIDKLVSGYLNGQGARLRRRDFEDIDALVIYEIVAQWLRDHGAVFDKHTIVRLCNGARNLQNGAKIDVDKRFYCQLTRNEIVLTER